MTATDDATDPRHEPLDPSQWTMDELVDRVREGISRLGEGGQPRYKVTDVPDARTVRYYVSLGLVDQPSARRGTYALYSRKHLLQILAIKKLQAEYLSIRKIQELIRGKEPAQLEALLGFTVGLEELASTSRPAQTPVAWQHYRLHPGIELHIKQGLHLDPPDLQRILDAVADALAGHRRS